MNRDELKKRLSGVSLPELVDELRVYRDELQERDMHFAADDLQHVVDGLQRRLYGDVRRSVPGG